MENSLQEIMERIGKQIEQRQDSHQIPSYECTTCKDTGWIYDEATNSFSKCSCREIKITKQKLKLSGISDAFKNLTFKTYKPYNSLTQIACNKAKNYFLDFLINENKRQGNSMAFLGNSGSGKTHLSLALANNLMAQNIDVCYMPYRESIIKLKQNILNYDAYNKIIVKLKDCRVLLIDDLFKCIKLDMPSSDISIIFEIINYRYVKNLPIIVSSEYTLKRIIAIDEATGSRIAEMCSDNIIEFVGKEYNYRLKHLHI